MPHLLRRFTTVLAISALVTGAGAAHAAPSDAPLAPHIQTALDKAVAAGTPGLVAVTGDDGTTRRGTAGVGNIRTEREPRSDGRFRIASVSKTFTATLVLQLAEDGRFDLDDPVQEYLPGLLPYPEPITIRQLLQHTSGMPRHLPPEHTWTSLPELDTERFVSFTPEEVVKLTTEQPLLFAPGSGWSYSNTGYTVLALLVEQASGDRYERVLRERILRPLGLWRTSVARDFPFLIRPAGRGYEQLYPAPEPLTDVTTYNYSRFFGSGSMISTAEDLNRFFGALLGGELLSADMLAQMQTTVPVTGPDGNYAGFDYGLGLMRLQIDFACPDAAPVWGHDGSLPGFGVLSLHSEDGDTQVSTMANQNMTRTQEARAWHIRAAAGAFCEPAPVTTFSAADLPQLMSLTGVAPASAG